MWIVILHNDANDTSELFGPFNSGKEAQEYGRAYRPIHGWWEARIVESPRPH